MIIGTVHGRIAKDPETFQWGQKGSTGLRLSIASSPTFGQGGYDGETTWVNGTIFNGADYFAKHLHKGQLVSIIGEIQQFRDKDGANYNVQILAQEVLFERGNNDNASDNSSQVRYEQTAPEDVPF